MTDAPEKERQPRKRRPNVRALITNAEKTGKRVKSVTVDGVTLTFAEPDASGTTTNPWDEIYNADQKRPS